MTLRMTGEQLALLRSGDPDARAKLSKASKGAQARARGKAWEREVEAWLNVGGWLWRAPGEQTFIGGRVYGLLRGKKGAPDYLLTHPTRGITCHRELKTGDAVLSPEQRLWRDSMLASGVDWAVWHPKDRDTIQRFVLGR